VPKVPEPPPPPMVGERGWLLLEYTGKAPGSRPWRGPVSKCVYWFGRDRRVGYVDARDGVKFIAPRRANDALPVFRVRDEDTG